MNTATPAASLPFRYAASDALAARNLDALRVDPAVLLRQQARDHGADVVGHAHAPERGHIGKELVDVGAVADGAAAEVRLDCAWCHGVHCDATATQLLGHVACEHLDGSFDGRIGREARKADARETGRQVHDATTVRHQRQQRLCEKEHALEVDIDHLVEQRLRRVGERCHVAVSCIVDEVIEGVATPGLTQSRAHLVCEWAECADISGIELQCDGLASDCLNLLYDGLRVIGAAVISDDHVSAPSGDGERSVAAQTAAGTRNNGDSVHG
ncbi:protein of unknown function [Hyphomicrobium sp. 1Nfss2.1]